jgi:hypothetical protein
MRLHSARATAGELAKTTGPLIFFLPTTIAFARGHEYRAIILVLNLFGWTGVCWLASLVWAVWPANKSLADPILGNVTGIGEPNVGDTLGEVEFGRHRGFAVASNDFRGRREPQFDFFHQPQLEPSVELSPQVGVPHSREDDHGSSRIDLLAKLAALRDKGVITQAEF